MSSQHAELRHGSNVRVSFFGEAPKVRRHQQPDFTSSLTSRATDLAAPPEPGQLSLTHTAEARVALRPAAPATPSPVTACAGTEKTDKRAEPETRHRRTGREQPFYPNEPHASIASAVVEFDP